MKPFIGIKKIWYGDVISEAVTKTSLKTLLGSMTEVKTHIKTHGSIQRMTLLILTILMS